LRRAAHAGKALQTEHAGLRLLSKEHAQVMAAETQPDGRVRAFFGAASGGPCALGKAISMGVGVRAADLSQLGALLVGGIGIGVALVNQRRQLNAQMYIEFSKRFEDLLMLFPTEAWLANRRRDQELPPPSREITECTLYCIQFVADVYHLHRGGYISRRLWNLWEREIKRTLKGPVFVREWSALAAEFSHDKEFLDYMAH
jgi:hypothetical protein